MLIDTHAHLYWESYKEDINKVIQRSLDAEIATIVNIGVDVEKSKTALEQVEGDLSKVKGFSAYSTIGIHPHDALHYARNKQDVRISLQKDIDKLEQIYHSNPKKVVGVGECGLDYVFSPEYMQAPDGIVLSILQIKDLQKQLFQAQIALSKKLNLPLIVHIRDDRSKDPNNTEAWDEVFELTGDHPTILHCYSGLSQTTQKAIQKNNILVSFAANITYPKNEYLKEAAKILPLNKILLETDSPFLSPQSKRGQRNEPSTVREIAQVIADLKGITFAEVTGRTSENARQIFAF